MTLALTFCFVYILIQNQFHSIFLTDFSSSIKDLLHGSRFLFIYLPILIHFILLSILGRLTHKELECPPLVFMTYFKLRDRPRLMTGERNDNSRHPLQSHASHCQSFVVYICGAVVFIDRHEYCVFMFGVKCEM